jgi:hypothetical protein
VKEQKIYPLSDVIALDAERKSALDKEFWSFYKLMKERIGASSEMKDLEIPLEKVKDAVQAAAFGRFFGIPMITIEEPEDWEK